VPSLFRRKSTDLVEDDSLEEPAEETEDVRAKGYTPSKRELGVVTPKRTATQRRRGAEPPPANRREAARRMRERQKTQRAESMEGMRRGDEKYLLPRDRGPERALVRNIVDARRTAGTWFFGGALLVLIGSSVASPLIQLVSNLMWLLLALGVVIDGVLISRKIKKLVAERFPNTTIRPRSLYLYGIMRSLMFRRMRVPKPQVDIGESV
jgi:Protein of unknown function (DUF3043)